MLENMFIGRPPGNYDRLLDFSAAKTGSLFFVPSATFLETATGSAATADAAPADATPPEAPVATPPRDGSLGIGSLKGDPSHE
jgi:putative iron-dependent peroxidase